VEQNEPQGLDPSEPGRRRRARVRASQRRIQRADAEEVHAIARADGSELFSALFVTAAFTGLRMGELRALRWTDVDFGRRVVHVRRSFTGSSFGAPKSQRVRSVPMSDPVARVLNGLSRRAHDTRPDDLVVLPRP
jgi:integrase